MAGHKKQWVAGVLGVIAVASLVGCADARKNLMHGKKAPDEFAVYSRAPLTMPPEFGLRPPTPGAARPGGRNPSGLAYKAVTGRTAPPAVRTTMGAFAGTPGEQALLRQAKALETDPMIRETVNKESSVLAEETQTVTEKLLFSQKAGSSFGLRVDPAKETQRLKENQALGKSLNDGDVPTIRQKKKGLLEDLFK